MVVAVEELIGLVERDGEGAAALREARVTLEMLLAMLASAAEGSRKATLLLVEAEVVSAAE